MSSTNETKRDKARRQFITTFKSQDFSKKNFGQAGMNLGADVIFSLAGGASGAAVGAWIGNWWSALIGLGVTYLGEIRNESEKQDAYKEHRLPEGYGAMKSFGMGMMFGSMMHGTLSTSSKTLELPAKERIKQRLTDFKDLLLETSRLDKLFAKKEETTENQQQVNGIGATKYFLYPQQAPETDEMINRSMAQYEQQIVNHGINYQQNPTPQMRQPVESYAEAGNSSELNAMDGINY